MELHKLIDALRVCADDDIICPACERYDEECDGSFNGTAQLMQCAADRLEVHEAAIKKLRQRYTAAKGTEKSLLGEVLALFGEAVEVVRCEECKHLSIVNGKEVYAQCKKTGRAFEPFITDTRTFSCSYGERR